MTIAAVPHRKWPGSSRERLRGRPGRAPARPEPFHPSKRPAGRTAQSQEKGGVVLPAELKQYTPENPANFAARLMLDLMDFKKMTPEEAGRLALKTAQEVLAEMGQNPDLEKALNTARNRLGFRFEDEKSAPQGRERRGRAGKPGGSRRPVV